ncbi:hypothetical protein TNCV_1341031 [Trichonephila clavipes]|uniref:Uncharacterized protein n=1 Tax=Trichonephila clavipes TaxID=2585209 RepID=A0A8X6VBF5_TRICX|nr:hypothetical protein TNCV_1341031 [Trichonephila clavipes]
MRPQDCKVFPKWHTRSFGLATPVLEKGEQLAGRRSSELHTARYEESCGIPWCSRRTFPVASTDAHTIHPCGYKSIDIGESSRSSNGGDANCG